MMPIKQQLEASLVSYSGRSYRVIQNSIKRRVIELKKHEEKEEEKNILRKWFTAGNGEEGCFNNRRYSDKFLTD